MSLVQPQQQPVVVYPNTVTNKPPSHHSDGSFGSVFIVLAIIIVVSAIACFLGSLCNKRFNLQKLKPTRNFRPKGDVEFGNHRKSRSEEAYPKEVHVEFRNHSKSWPKEVQVEFGNHSFGSKEGDVEFGNHSFRSKERDVEIGNHSFRTKDGGGDIELGFDKKIPSVKINGNRESRGFKNIDDDDDDDDGLKGGA